MFLMRYTAVFPSSFLEDLRVVSYRKFYYNYYIALLHKLTPVMMDTFQAF